MSPIIAPSLLAADPLEIKKEIASIEKAGADWHHFDVMDGHFVNNLSFGPPLLKAVKSCAKIPLDVHIMVSNPQDVFSQYIDAGADYLTFHVEATKDALSLIEKIKARGVKAGVALSPQTNVSAVFDLLGRIDLVLIMSVNPGFGGQAFIPETLDKVKSLAEKLGPRKSDSDVKIHVDGGVTDSNAASILRAGATGLIAGSYVYKHPRRDIAIKSLRH